MADKKLKQRILNEIAVGATAQQCAEKYNIPAGTIRSWVSRTKRCKKDVAVKKDAASHKSNNETAKKAAQHKKGATKKKATVIENPIIKFKDVNEELTEKQRLFCLFYIRNFNATQAAIKAGYSPNTARQIGYELLTNPHIRAEVQRLKEIKIQSIMITEDDIVERYMRVAFADMTDVAEWGTEEVIDFDPNGAIPIDKDGKVKMLKLNYLNFKGSDQVDGGLICEISKGKHGLKIKLEDRQKALDWLANYFNMNPMNKHKIKYDNAVLKLREQELKLKEW